METLCSFIQQKDSLISRQIVGKLIYVFFLPQYTILNNHNSKKPPNATDQLTILQLLRNS